eukprot:scaffold27414_cov22-Tisochrysis_lutea.AAC.2
MDTISLKSMDACSLTYCKLQSLLIQSHGCSLNLLQPSMSPMVLMLTLPAGAELACSCMRSQTPPWSAASFNTFPFPDAACLQVHAHTGAHFAHAGLAWMCMRLQVPPWSAASSNASRFADAGLATAFDLMAWIIQGPVLVYLKEASQVCVHISVHM